MNENIILAGSGSRHPALMMWTTVNHMSAPMIISEFLNDYSVYAIAVSPSAKRVAAGTKAGLLRVHPIPDGQESEETAPLLFDVFHRPGVDSLAFCTDETVASGGRDGRIKLWSVTGKQLLAEIPAHQGSICALCCIRPQQLASLGEDGYLRVWDMNSREKQYESDRFSLPSIRALTSLDFHPESGLLLHPSADGNLYLYDVRDGFNSQLFSAHKGNFTALAYGLHYLVTAGLDDADIKLWDLTAEKLIGKTTASGGVLSVGWAGDNTVLTVFTNGSGQFWTVNNGTLHPGPRITDLHLRTVGSLSAAFRSNRQTTANLTWRNQKLEQAKELVDQPEKHDELISIVNQLCQHGFVIEGLLVQADAAKVQEKPLWELECRRALDELLGDTQAAVPSLFALAELLETIKEPQEAQRILGKILKIDPDSDRAKEQMDRLQSNPLMHLCPQTDIRGDLLQQERILQELEKYTILDKKFTWRFAMSIGQTELLDPDRNTEEFADLKIEELAAASCQSITRSVKDIAPPAWTTATLYCHGQARPVSLIYVPAEISAAGIVFALEIDLTSAKAEFIPYKLFDPALLNIPDTLSAKNHNEQIQKAYQDLSKSDSANDWWDSIHQHVIQTVRDCVKDYLADQDDEF